MNKICLVLSMALCVSCMCQQSNVQAGAPVQQPSEEAVEQVAPPVEVVQTPPAEKVVETKTPEPKAVIDTTGKTKLEIMMESIGLVDIATLTDDIPVSLMYARDDNFTGKILYKDLSRAYLHPEAARALLKAQAELKKIRPDLSLKVYDAARPMSVQKIMHDAVKGTEQHIYVSNPAKGGGLHNYGLAVDVTLCDVATGEDRKSVV